MEFVRYCKSSCSFSGFNKLIVTLALCIFLTEATAQRLDPSAPYHDLTHYSKVFGHEKFYRLYLPKGYENSSTRYPVIYFFHGWGGRHFKDDSAKLEYEKIKELVDKYNVILVMWDGNIVEEEPRPYNVGDHENVKFQVQMKDYFPELIAHIDSTYRTLSDRNHRGIIGFSMGGFMAFFLAGKYPGKVSAVVNLAGSPEFFVGYPDNHSLYPVRYTFKNLEGIKLRQHNGDSDILYYLNREVHAGAQWEGVPLEYWEFHGGHMVDQPGETRVFEMAMRFITDAFNKPSTGKPEQWSHYDLYPDFNVWDYHVTSDKQEPGFLLLDDVDKKGFGVYTQRWLPDGPPLNVHHIHVETAPFYESGKTYNFIKFTTDAQITTGEKKSDGQGRLTFDLDGNNTEVGIYSKNDAPSFAFLNYSINKQSRYLKTDQASKLTVTMVNKGGEKGLPKTVKVSLHTKDSSVQIVDSVLTVKVMPGQRVITLPAVNIRCSKTPPPHAGPSAVKVEVKVNSNGSLSTDEFITPVWFDVPEFKNIHIDDNTAVGDTVLGRGNGDGIVNVGEKIMLYEGDHRLRVYTEDPWVQRDKEQLYSEIIPARWPDGYTLSSLIQISPDCPEGHVVEALASYETKSFNPIERKVTWGMVKFIVHHK